jgi:hypothetical protein
MDDYESSEGMLSSNDELATEAGVGALQEPSMHTTLNRSASACMHVRMITFGMMHLSAAFLAVHAGYVQGRVGLRMLPTRCNRAGLG